MDNKLFDSELKVMSVLWREGECTAKHISDVLKKEVGWNMNTIFLTACVATPLSTAEDKSEAKENNVQTENDDVVDDTLHISDVLSRSKELSFNEVLARTQ